MMLCCISISLSNVVSGDDAHPPVDVIVTPTPTGEYPVPLDPVPPTDELEAETPVWVAVVCSLVMPVVCTIWVLVINHAN